MAEKVEFTLEAHDAGAVRAWQALAREIASYQRELAQIEAVERQNERAAQAHERAARRIIESLLTPQERYNRKLEELTTLRRANLLSEQQYAAAVRKTQAEFAAQQQLSIQGFSNVLTSIGRAAAAYMSLTAAVRGWTEANRQAIEEAEQAAHHADEQARRFAVQAGLRELEAQAADEQILTVAEETGVSADFARKAATQLVSSGFSAQDASGEALRVLLQGLAASNLLDQDPTQLTQALGQFLAATGQDKNAENLRRAVVGAQRLFKATDLQVSDLSQLAGKTQGLAGVMSPEEVLATFDVLREKTGADQAATALKIFGDRLRGAREDKQRVDVLRQMGLRAEDVDLLGEDVQTVLDRLASGLERVKPERRSGLIQKLFGTEVSSPIEGLLRDREQIAQNLKTITDQGGFAQDVEIATSGRAAAKRRQEVARERRAIGRDERGDLLLEEMEALAEERGFDAFARWRLRAYARTGQWLGLSAETAADWASTLVIPGIGAGDDTGGGAAFFEEARKRLDRRLGPASVAPPVVGGGVREEPQGDLAPGRVEAQRPNGRDLDRRLGPASVAPPVVGGGVREELTMPRLEPGRLTRAVHQPLVSPDVERLTSALEHNTQVMRQLAEATRENSVRTQQNTLSQAKATKLPNSAPAPLPRAAARR